jgi:hypothetical protein
MVRAVMLPCCNAQPVARGAPAALKKIPREAAQPPRIFAEKAALSAVLHLNVVKFYKVMLLCSA